MFNLHINFFANLHLKNGNIQKSIWYKNISGYTTNNYTCNSKLIDNGICLFWGFYAIL